MPQHAGASWARVLPWSFTNLYPQTGGEGVSAPSRATFPRRLGLFQGPELPAWI